MRPARSSRPTGGTPASVCRSARVPPGGPTGWSRRCPSRRRTPWSTPTHRPPPTPSRRCSAALPVSAAWPRHHRRVGARVIEALTVERAELGKLPDPLPATERHLEVRASRDGFVRVASVDYSMPPGYAGRRVQIRLALHELRIFCEGRLVAAHVRSYVPADVVRDGEHMAALREAQAAQRRLRDGEPELPAVDLARYDALVGAPL